LVGLAMAAASEVDPGEDPWRPERCVWPLIDVIDQHGEDPQLTPLIAHLRAATPDDRRGQPGPLRRFATARHLADLFDHYAVHRPDMVMAWLAGASVDVGDDLTPAWQAFLWRLLRERIGVPSPAERFHGAARRLAAAPERLPLPERVSLFGLTRLPASHLEVLQAVADGRDVHLFLLHPSGRLWEQVAECVPRPPLGMPRTHDPTAQLAANPLLRSWGRDAREMQLVLAARGVAGGEYRPIEDAPETLLGHLQAAIRADLPPPGTPASGLTDRRPVLDAADRTVQVHACHGRARQVEVLRDALLHLLAGDGTLEPRHVIVMCPDIETFAPLIHAAFGPDDPANPDAGESQGTGLPRLRVRLADRSVRQTNPLLNVAAQLLVLAGARVTASEVLDLAARPPVARRFRFDQDDLSTLERWVSDTGIRWGLDADHRRPWALDRVTANTWAFGLDRLLLGVTMAEGDGRTFGGALPYDDVSSSEVDLAGRVAEFVERLSSALDRLAGTQPAAMWVEALVSGTELIAEAAAVEQWQHDQLRRLLTEVVDEGGAGAGPMLSLPEVHAVLASRLQGRPTVANFRTGDLTVCTLVPMRSVPHRVVALLGLDDGSFPRHPETDGDDLLLAAPRVGDRDPRSEDRQLLLDAVLAATDHFLITYSGKDERTNRERPPAVPVAELLDAIDSTVRVADGRLARERVVMQHPLQPFDVRNFSAGTLGVDGPWSYDRVQLAGSRMSLHQQPAPPWLPQALPPFEEPVLQLDDLVRFVEHPVRAFLRRRLGLYLSDRNEHPDDSLPIDLDNLERWGVGDRLLQARLAGIDPDRAAEAERARGLLPPDDLADRLLGEIRGEVEQLAVTVASLGFEPGPAESVDIHVDLPGGRSLIGAVPNLRGDTILVCHYSRLGARHRLGAWVRFLALSAGWPELDATLLTVGRGPGRQPPKVSRLEPLAASSEQRRDRALVELAVLLELYSLGMCSPLKLVCNTSAAWAEALFRGKTLDDAYRAAKDVWDDGRFPGETSDPEHAYVWGGSSSLDFLVEDPLFSTLARRLWDPLLAHEQIVAP
jgi:exodeoxyribonuclease V gamma subunit